MPDQAAQPDDEFSQMIRNAILAGAAEGAETTARRIAEAASTGLEEVRAVLQALGARTTQAVTVSGSASLSSMAVAGSIQVTDAAAGLYGAGRLGGAAGAALSGAGTLGVGVADVAAAADELRVIRQPDVEKLAGRPPVRWTRQELILNSLSSWSSPTGCCRRRRGRT